MTEKPENVLWIGAIGALGTGKTQIESCSARLVGRTDSEQRVVYWDPHSLGAVDYAAMLHGPDCLHQPFLLPGGDATMLRGLDAGGDRP